MHKIKFFKDFANIMDWAYTQHHGCQDGTDQTLAYAAALEPMKKLNDELFNFFWDAETSTYRYPTEQEIEDNANKKKLFENLYEYYQEIVNAADAYYKFVNQWNQENQKKREAWDKWKTAE